MSTALENSFQKALRDTGTNYLAIQEELGDELSASLTVVPGPDGTVLFLADGDQDASIYLTPGQHKQLQAYLNEWEQ